MVRWRNRWQSAEYRTLRIKNGLATVGATLLLLGFVHVPFFKPCTRRHMCCLRRSVLFLSAHVRACFRNMQGVLIVLSLLWRVGVAGWMMMTFVFTNMLKGSTWKRPALPKQTVGRAVTSAGEENEEGQLGGQLVGYPLDSRGVWFSNSGENSGFNIHYSIV